VIDGTVNKVGEMVGGSSEILRRLPFWSACLPRR
jgi:hypothetical protein